MAWNSSSIGGLPDPTRGVDDDPSILKAWLAERRKKGSSDDAHVRPGQASPGATPDSITGFVDSRPEIRAAISTARSSRHKWWRRLRR